MLPLSFLKLSWKGRGKMIGKKKKKEKGRDPMFSAAEINPAGQSVTNHWYVELRQLNTFKAFRVYFWAKLHMLTSVLDHVLIGAYKSLNNGNTEPLTSQETRMPFPHNCSNHSTT